MAKRPKRYNEKPWIRDPAVLKRWQELIGKGTATVAYRDLNEDKPAPPAPVIQPKDGWQLWDWKTLEDRPQE